MKKNCFLAETPRGGPHGHRFIVPSDTKISSSEIEDYFQRASQGESDDFLAVKRVVEQRLPNGAIREGAETILIAGVKVSKLSPNQQHGLNGILTKRLSDLDALITHEIDWDVAGNNTIIIRKELAEWWEADSQTFIAGEVKTKNKSPKTAGIAGSAIGVLLGLAAGCLALYIWFL